VVVVETSAKVLIFILVDVVFSVSSMVMHPQTSIIAATATTYFSNLSTLRVFARTSIKSFYMVT
jgi:hypothetical protein